MPLCPGSFVVATFATQRWCDESICVYLRYLRFLLCDAAMDQIKCDGSVSSAKSVSKTAMVR